MFSAAGHIQKGRSTSAFNIANTTVLAPMAKASVATARDGKSRRFAELPKRESKRRPHIDSRVGHCQISRAVFSANHGQVPECDARLARCASCGLRPSPIKWLNALFKMKAHFLRKIVKELAATEDAGESNSSQPPAGWQMGFPHSGQA